MKPIIGINLDLSEGSPSQVSLNATYYQAIQKAGAIPLPLIPMPDDDLRQLISLLGGMIFIGGRDYHPKSYGDEVRSKLSLTHPIREDFDLRLATYSLKETRIPILGICAGHQLINIALGGTLIQDIGAEPIVPSKSVSDIGKQKKDTLSNDKLPTTLTDIPHNEAAAPGPIRPTQFVNHGAEDPALCAMSKHPINILDKTELQSIYGRSNIIVSSSHHQAIDQLGQGLRVSARASDGLIEAIEAPQRPFTIGVQFHPERDDDSSLFDALAAAAQKYLAGRNNSFILPLTSQAGLLGLYG